MTERIDIGIDGGGTGCRVILSRGGEARHYSGGPANVVTDPAGAEAAIRLVLDRALADHGLGVEALQHARICAGLAGCRLPGEADRFATRLPFLAYVVDDSVTALEAAFAGGDGALVSLGTGSFFIAKSGGSIRHVGGWGFVLGDEGSAAWLGRRALAQALRVVDGRLPADPLAEALLTATPPHPVHFARTASPGQFAQLAKLVPAHAATPMAQALIGDVLVELRDGLAALGHAPGNAWCLTGGLGDLLRDHLPDDLRAELVPPQGRALDGALRLAQALP